MVLCVQYGLTCIQQRKVSSSEPFEDEKSSSPFLSNASRFQKDSYFLEGSQAWPVCPPTTSNV